VPVLVEVEDLLEERLATLALVIASVPIIGTVISAISIPIPVPIVAVVAVAIVVSVSIPLISSPLIASAARVITVARSAVVGVLRRGRGRRGRRGRRGHRLGPAADPVEDLVQLAPVQPHPSTLRAEVDLHALSSRDRQGDVTDRALHGNTNGVAGVGWLVAS
jgi:hypothetical protein